MKISHSACQKNTKHRILRMCRSSQYFCSTVECEVKVNEKSRKDAVKFSLIQEGKEKGTRVAINERTTRDPTKDSHGQRLLDVKAEEKGNSRSPTMETLSPRKTFYHFSAQDINIAVTNFPEFFSQKLERDQDSFAKSQKHKILTRDLSVRRQSLKNECGGLILWYIREYGL